LVESNSDQLLKLTKETAHITFSPETIARVSKRLTPLRDIMFEKPQEPYWKFKNFEGQEQKSLEENINIRIEVSEKLSFEKGKKLNEIHEWIVKDWGGIKTGADISNLLKQTNDKLKQDVYPTLDRIASISKCLSFQKPEKFAIYDSRAVYALNAILYETGLAKGEKYFPPVAGRNKLLSTFDISTIITLDDIMKNTEVRGKWVNFINDKAGYKDKVKPIEPSGEIMPTSSFMQNAIAYRTYTELLKKLNKELFANYKLKAKSKNLLIEDFTNYPFLTEMILFHFADKDILENVIKNYPKITK
jgi:hypothetical protein